MTMLVPVFIAVTRAICDARRSAANEARKSGFLASDMSCEFIGFPPTPIGLAPHLRYQTTPNYLLEFDRLFRNSPILLQNDDELQSREYHAHPVAPSLPLWLMRPLDVAKLRKTD